MKYENNKIVYETGDWVYGWHSKTIEYFDKAWRVESISEDSYGVYIHPRLNYSTGINNVRPATQEEINSAPKEEKIFIDEYEVRFGGEVNEAENWGKEIITVGCKIISKDLFLKIGKRANWI